MSFKITDNTATIKAATQQKGSIFLRFMTDAMVSTAEPNTPKKTGRLRMDVVKQVLGLKGKVVWGKNYGRWQETKQFTNYTTPGTGPKFAENAAKKLQGFTATIAKKAGLI